MKNLGYEVSFNGTCYGIASMAIQAAMEQCPRFVCLMELMKDHQKLARTVHGIKLKRALNSANSFIQRAKLNQNEIELLAFLDGVNIFNPRLIFLGTIGKVGRKSIVC